MRRTALIILLAFLAAACQPSDTEVPTLFVLPSLTPVPTETSTATPTDTDVPTETSLPTETNTPTDIPTETLTPSDTPTPSRTPVPSATPNATGAAIGTATAQVLEAPVISTFTPLPPGIIGAVRPTSTGTPEVIADVVITQAQFQEEIDRILEDNPDVGDVEILLGEAGLFVTLTASGGEALTTGRFLINFELSVGSGGFDNLVIIQPASPDNFVMRDGNEPSEEFIAIAHGAVTEAVFQAFDDILNQRLGQGQHNLEFITLADGQMGISLLVPER